MEPTTRPQDAPPQDHRRHVRRTRVSAAWVTSIVAAVVLILLLIFIAQNSQRVSVSFLGAHGHLPLGVALLLAAACGVLFVAIPGTARIVQLRRAARKAAAPVAPAPGSELTPEPVRPPAEPDLGKDPSDDTTG
ncbi:lipopolysaccharide assembly protein LapA domain-containing protein [Streptacidiphilus rugosus]|uniref:lipopolysaccharide assembly protein LapA domain-containing protein n=1 Tax=Streptacidiphilus rugosus TaxID=405783 RepID=UPI0007C7C253|nr:lipopolysaccharide assembly protein LapA domain-containing protein [Streptacidiphilus rugosus]